MLNIAIADDQPIFSQGMKQLLETQNRFNVVGIGKNESELNELVSRHSVNLAIVDFGGTLIKRMMICKKLRLSYPGLKIIVISTSEETNICRELKSIGVSGYIFKSCEGIDFINAVNAVWQGKTVFPEAFSKETEKSQIFFMPEQVASELTAREKEIVSLVGRGFTSPAIAEKLYISINTVKGHRKNILKKLNLKNIQELVAYSIAQCLC